MISLEYLKPPPVEPAQAPIRVRTKSKALEKAGQVLKSSVAKPVVVIMEETVNSAW